MTDVGLAVSYLKKQGIEAVEGSGILIVPCSSPSEIVDLVSTVRKHLDDVGYDKSWIIDPYYYSTGMKGERSYEFD